MTKPRGGKKQTAEHFTFEVETWSYDYGLHINAAPGVRKYLGLCSETNAITLRGALRSRTRRRVVNVQLRLDPGGHGPHTWKEEWKGLGAVTSIGGGTMEAFLRVPTSSLQAILTAIGFGKIRFATIKVDFADDRRLLTDIHTSETLDEED